MPAMAPPEIPPPLLLEFVDAATAPPAVFVLAIDVLLFDVEEGLAEVVEFAEVTAVVRQVVLPPSRTVKMFDCAII